MLLIFSLNESGGGGFTPGTRLTETARLSAPILEFGAVMSLSRVGVTSLERAFSVMIPLKTRLIVPSA